MSRRLVLLRVGVAGLTLALAACGGSSGDHETMGSTGTSTGETIRVEASEFAFSPKTIEVTAGQPVTVEFVNKGSTEHDFEVEDMPVEMDHGSEHGGGGSMVHAHAAAGKSATITFTPSTPGTYEFICTIAGHKDAGMVGSVVVK